MLLSFLLAWTTFLPHSLRRILLIEITVDNALDHDPLSSSQKMGKTVLSDMAISSVNEDADADLLN